MKKVLFRQDDKDDEIFSNQLEFRGHFIYCYYCGPDYRLLNYSGKRYFWKALQVNRNEFAIGGEEGFSSFTIAIAACKGIADLFVFESQTDFIKWLEER